MTKRHVELYEVGQPYTRLGIRERRQVSIWQLTDDDRTMDNELYGEPGTWAYNWLGREVVGGYATFEDAHAAALAAGREDWPDMSGPVEPEFQ